MISLKKKLLMAGRRFGQSAFTVPGTYRWRAPAGVRTVCVLCVGAGGAAGGTFSGNGGNLRYENDYVVIPGQEYEIFVPDGNTPSPTEGAPLNRSAIFNGDLIAFGGIRGNDQPLGSGRGVGFTGGRGGNSTGEGGGGAAGYAGNGGNARTSNSGTAGSGGGGGAGNFNSNTTIAGAGGGVGILGQGPNGGGGSPGSPEGKGGSLGQNGSATEAGRGGNFGGGGVSNRASGAGGNGAVRIIWGEGRSFPSNKTGDM